MSDVDDELEGAQGLPNYIRTKPMTDPTADAAKLRDDLTKLLAHIEDGPYIGAVGVADAVLNWAAENIADLSRELARGTLQNSRPQPAPPEGEPDFEKLRTDAITAWRKCSKDDPFWGRREVFLVRYSYRLGLAARTKVGDKEVAELVKRMRSKKMVEVDLFQTVADLLERRAGELDLEKSDDPSPIPAPRHP